jgi:hypothetical protein
VGARASSPSSRSLSSPLLLSLSLLLPLLPLLLSLSSCPLLLAESRRLAGVTRSSRSLAGGCAATGGEGAAEALAAASPADASTA